MQISLIFEWLVSVADSIIYVIVIFFLIIFVLITSLFEDENSIYCESFDSPMQLCETSNNDLPKASSFN
jgi:hypothetical protein